MVFYTFPIQEALCYAGPGIGTHVFTMKTVEHTAVTGIEPVSITAECFRPDIKNAFFHFQDFRYSIFLQCVPQRTYIHVELLLHASIVRLIAPDRCK